MTIPPTSAAIASTASAPAELTDQEIAQLRSAAGWARFVAVVGFILSAVAAFIFVAFKITGTGGEFGSTTFALYFAITVIGVAVAAALILGYGQNVLAFFRHGDPALAQAFRRLRLFFTLWTLIGAIDILFEVVSLLGKR